MFGYIRRKGLLLFLQLPIDFVNEHKCTKILNAYLKDNAL